MDFLIIFTPGLIASGLLEILQKKKLSYFSFVKHTLIFDLFSNLCTIFIYYYIFHGENSIIEHFNDNRFLLLYAALNILLALILSVFYYVAAPHIRLSIVGKKKKREKTHAEKNF